MGVRMETEQHCRGLDQGAGSEKGRLLDLLKDSQQESPMDWMA